mmetsp:Transcript_38021/g.151049  ORF Transcript_38021/g.151049 Transcript_38021/m.151049 type:complete len:203 (-) Transcript_38021:463-1071(-)
MSASKSPKLLLSLPFRFGFADPVPPDSFPGSFLDMYESKSMSISSVDFFCFSVRPFPFGGPFFFLLLNFPPFFPSLFLISSLVIIFLTRGVLSFVTLPPAFSDKAANLALKPPSPPPPPPRISPPCVLTLLLSFEAALLTASSTLPPDLVPPFGFIASNTSTSQKVQPSKKILPPLLFPNQSPREQDRSTAKQTKPNFHPLG